MALEVFQVVFQVAQGDNPKTVRVRARIST